MLSIFPQPPNTDWVTSLPPSFLSFPPPPSWREELRYKKQKKELFEPSREPPTQVSQQTDVTWHWPNTHLATVTQAFTNKTTTGNIFLKKAFHLTRLPGLINSESYLGKKRVTSPAQTTERVFFFNVLFTSALLISHETPCSENPRPKTDDCVTAS